VRLVGHRFIILMPVSTDLKAQILVLFHQQRFNVKKICGLLRLKKTLVYKTLQYARAYGVPYNPHAHKPGRRRILSQGDVQFIVALLTRKHTIYIDEIQEQLRNERGVAISIPTLWRTLHRLHYSCKGVSVRALERNDLLRSAFMNKIADEVMNPDMLMFVDEAARDKRTSGRKKGWSVVGKRCVQRRCFGRGERFSILPILTLDGIITYDIIPGSVTSARFLQFLCELVVHVFLHVFGLLTQCEDPPLQSLPRSSKHPCFGQLQYPPL
jgi:transposase